MKNYQIICFISWILILCTESFAQSEKLTFADEFMLGTSITYIPNFVEDVYRYHEWTWSLNASVNLNHRLSVGLNNLWLLTHGTRVKKDNFDLFGFYSQYSFVRQGKHRGYGETGLYWGNYCTCGFKDPYKAQGLNYLSIGGGYERTIAEHFNVEVGFLVYRILNKRVEPITGYTQYVLGINYMISH